MVSLLRYDFYQLFLLNDEFFLCQLFLRSETPIKIAVKYVIFIDETIGKNSTLLLRIYLQKTCDPFVPSLFKLFNQLFFNFIITKGMIDGVISYQF